MHTDVYRKQNVHANEEYQFQPITTVMVMMHICIWVSLDGLTPSQVCVCV
jgi:hypothetical protein